MIVVVLCLMLFSATAQAGNLFDMGRVEYFSKSTKLRYGLDKMQETIDWREPVIGTDGKTHYYTPPHAVLNLLNDPSDKNAQAYLDWQKLRTERIIEAQKAIEHVQIDNKRAQ